MSSTARPALTETGEHRVQQAADYVRRHRWLILAGLITAAVIRPARMSQRWRRT
jgi:hypothetical protein